MERTHFLDIKNYSKDSLQYGFQTLEDIINAGVERSKAGGSSHVFLTENSTLFSAPEFISEARKNNLVPVVGLTIHVLNSLSKEVTGTLTMYAKDDDGFASLVSILSNVEKVNGQNCITLSNIKKSNPNGLKVLLGGQDSLLYEFIKKTFSNNPEIKEQGVKLGGALIPFLKNTFGEQNVNFEVQPARDEEQARINNIIRKMAAKDYVPVIPTFDIRATKKNDIPLLMNKGKALVLKKDDQYDYQKSLSKNSYRDYFKSIDYEKEFTIDEINNLNEFTLDFKGEYSLLPDEIYVPSSEKDLKQTAFESLEKLIENKTEQEKKVYRERLNHEYEVIHSLGFDNYFLIFDDIVKNVKDANFMLRGSSIGSLMTHVLGISNVDPIEHGLLFERFLNKGRASRNEYPDVDLETDKIPEIQAFLKKRYGEDGAFLMTDRSSKGSKTSLMFIKDAICESLDNEESKKDFQNACFKLYEPIKDKKYFKAGEGSLKEEIKKYPEYMNIIGQDKVIQAIVKLAFKVEDQTTGYKKSPSSYVIIPQEKKRLFSESALLPKTGKDEDSNILRSLEITKKTAPLLGLVKLDILHNVVLGRLNKLLNARKDIKPDIEMKNENAYNILSNGMTFGIFQLSNQSPLCARVKPKNFDDLVSVMALMRPGISRETKTLFFENRKTGKNINMHPLIDDILQGTHGAILFDEQIMLIAQKVAGYSPDESDNFRSLLKSNKLDKLQEQKSIFIEGGIKKGVEPQTMEKLFTTIEGMCGKYTFNKAHAIAYAKVAYQQAYIAHYHPAEYLSSFVLEDNNKDYEPKDVIERLGKINGFSLRLPKPNEVYNEYTTVTENNNRISGVVPMSRIVSNNTFEAILSAKEEKPFQSFSDMIKRSIKFALNVKSAYSFEIKEKKRETLFRSFVKDFELLIKLGMFDHVAKNENIGNSLLDKRIALVENMESLLEHIKEPYINNYDPVIYAPKNKTKLDISSVISDETKFLFGKSPMGDWLHNYQSNNQKEEDAKNDERKKKREQRAKELALKAQETGIQNNAIFNKVIEDLNETPNNERSNYKFKPQ